MCKAMDVRFSIFWCVYTLFHRLVCSHFEIVYCVYTLWDCLLCSHFEIVCCVYILWDCLLCLHTLRLFAVIGDILPTYCTLNERKANHNFTSVWIPFFSKLFHVRPVTQGDVIRADKNEIPRIFQVSFLSYIFYFTCGNWGVFSSFI